MKKYKICLMALSFLASGMLFSCNQMEMASEPPIEVVKASLKQMMEEAKDKTSWEGLEVVSNDSSAFSLNPKALDIGVGLQTLNISTYEETTTNIEWNLDNLVNHQFDDLLKLRSTGEIGAHIDFEGMASEGSSDIFLNVLSTYGKNTLLIDEEEDTSDFFFAGFKGNYSLDMKALGIPTSIEKELSYGLLFKGLATYIQDQIGHVNEENQAFEFDLPYTLEDLINIIENETEIDVKGNTYYVTIGIDKLNIIDTFVNLMNSLGLDVDNILDFYFQVGGLLTIQIGFDDQGGFASFGFSTSDFVGTIVKDEETLISFSEASSWTLTNYEKSVLDLTKEEMDNYGWNQKCLDPTKLFDLIPH